MCEQKKQPQDIDARLDTVMSLAMELDAKAKQYPADFTPACMMRQIMSDNDLFGDEATMPRDIARICIRAASLMPGMDEPRYSMHDYADAIAHARIDLVPDKLLALDDESFATAMIWLATANRETYEGREHCQEPAGPVMGLV